MAEQDDTRRKPDTFTETWRAHLSSSLDQVTIDLHGWSVVTVADLDFDLA